MRAEARVRRGVRGYGNAGPTRPRSIPSVRAFDEERHHDGPDGLGLAAGMSGEARHDLRSRNPGARERRSAAAVEPLARGAFHDTRGQVLRGFSLRVWVPHRGDHARYRVSLRTPTWIAIQTAPAARYTGASSTALRSACAPMPARSRYKAV